MNVTDFADTTWMSHGNCAHRDPSMFFPSDGVGVEIAGVTVQEVDPVALVEIPAHGGLAGDHRFGGAQQFGIGQPQSRTERVAERRAGVELQHPVDGVAQRLGRDGAPMGAAAADQVVFLDHRHRFSFLGGFHGGPFSSRAGADHDNIVVLIAHSCALRGIGAGNKRVSVRLPSRAK